MSNSSLVVYTKLSPNHSGQRNHVIDRISPHCVVGQVSAESLGEWFSYASTKASSNYGIDKDGRVGMYVEEKNRSWCTSSSANDNRAVTIECASDLQEPYWMNDKVYASLIKLCADICKRNGKTKLLWFADKNKSLNNEPKADEMLITVHRWFANKSCPGDWLYARLGDVASKVTAMLGGGPVDVTPVKSGLTKGDTGEDVRTMQTMLIACGYGCGSTGADGDFGKNTLAALTSFRSEHSLSADGIYDSKTKAALEKAYKKTLEAKTPSSGLQAKDLKSLPEKDVISKVGPLFVADQKKNGILASVSLAQFILESGYGKSELAFEANNCFGMKKTLSGNNWGGSTWDGTSIYTKKTQEQNTDGSYVTVTADFRKYPDIEASIADHSAYLLGAKNGSKLRYEGLKGCTDYRKAAQIIKKAGYATSIDYVDKLCSIITRWNLTVYDDTAVSPVKENAVTFYRVRKEWKDSSSQIGAFTVLENAKACVDLNPGYAAFDEKGQVVYPEEKTSFTPYFVRIIAEDLNIRKGPSATAETHGFIEPGAYTIVDEKDGWGLLKAYKEDRDGWVKLAYTQRIK